MKENKKSQMQVQQKLLEEQDLEVEALKSIFQDDFVELEKTGGITHKFSITIDASGDKKSSYVAVKLEIGFSHNYPKKAPQITVVKLKGLSDVCSNTCFCFFL